LLRQAQKCPAKLSRPTPARQSAEEGHPASADPRRRVTQRNHVARRGLRSTALSACHDSAGTQHSDSRVASCVKCAHRQTTARPSSHCRAPPLDVAWRARLLASRPHEPLSSHAAGDRSGGSWAACPDVTPQVSSSSIIMLRHNVHTLSLCTQTAHPAGRAASRSPCRCSCARAPRHSHTVKRDVLRFAAGACVRACVPSAPFARAGRRSLRTSLHPTVALP